MRVIPLSVELSWPIPNYVDPPTRGPALVIVNSVMITLVVITVALRLYTRLIMLRWFGIDDLFIILALISTIGMTAAVILANVDYGWNRHIWDLPPDKFAGAMIMAFVTKIIFSAAATFTRLSLLTFYYRLVKDSTMRSFRWVLHISTFFTAMTLPFFVLITIFQCSPIRAYWTYPALPDQKCLSEGKLTMGCGIVNTFLDFLVTTIPIPLIINLQLPWRRRLGAIVLVSLGLIVTIAGALRSYFVWQGLLSSYDETWYSYGLWISAAIEIDLGVICACAPALRLLFVKKIGTQQLSSWGSYIGRHTGSYKLSNMLSSISSRRRRRQEERSSPLAGEKEFEESEVSGSVTRESHTTSHLWDEPWSGDNAPKGGRISTVIPTGVMSPIRVDGATFEIDNKGFGNHTIVTAGASMPSAFTGPNLASPTYQDWPLVSQSNDEEQVTLAASMRKHTGFNFNVEHQPRLGVLDEAATDEEEDEWEGEGEGEDLRKQSVEIRELPIYNEQEDVELGRAPSEPRQSTHSEHRPRRSSDRARRQRSEYDIAKERTRRWREKQQKQQGYGWSLGNT